MATIRSLAAGRHGGSHIPASAGILASARLPLRKWLGIAVTVAAFALLVILTAFPVRAAENAFRLGHQESGTFVLVTGKAGFEAFRARLSNADVVNGAGA